ncbi:MAG: thiamine ABC transporter substrate binding subunit [Pseudomonadota bacterium]
MVRPILVAAALCICAIGAQAQSPKLTVYTYDSFVTEWGPGPAVEAAFEAECGCELELVGAGDGAALLARLQLEGERSDADVVLGLDTTLTAQAAATGLFVEHGITPRGLTLPIAWEDATFLPYDWGHFAFVYDNTLLADAPDSFEALLAAEELSIVIQDPRSSTPGLGLLMWVKAVYGDRAQDIWEALAPRIVTVTKGWSEAYGLFLEGEADMVLSYTTSPAYHLIAEEDPSKSAAAFAEGHYMQIEVAGALAASDQPELAAQFLEFMLTQPFQEVIPTTNWMYPAALSPEALPAGYEKMIQPDVSLLIPADQVPAMKEEALAEWLVALSK